MSNSKPTKRKKKADEHSQNIADSANHFESNSLSKTLKSKTLNQASDGLEMALYLGESYAELAVRSQSSALMLKKTFFLPQTSIKNILLNYKKNLPDSLGPIKSIYIVSKYLDRLKSFRLGGSVVQVLNSNQENNYTFENSENLSLAASALVIGLKNNFTDDQLTKELLRIRKINPECSKVVISLFDFTDDQIQKVTQFFKSEKFTIFINPQPRSMKSLRKTLINAGAEGTKEEIVQDVKESLGLSEVYFWINDKFTKDFSNIDLFFSSDYFLNDCLKTENPSHQLLIHTDLERWIVLKNEFQNEWHSPWGSVEQKHIKTYQIGLHPFSEVLINSSGQLSFSKMPAAIEPGPMIAGRSVKALVVDAFYKVINQKSHLTELFPKLKEASLLTKIESQFKVLEKGQVHYDNPLDLSLIQDFIINKLGYDILLHKTKEDKILWTGHLNFIFQQLDQSIIDFSWTEKIFLRTHRV